MLSEALLAQIAEQNDYAIVDRAEIAGKEAVYAEIPSALSPELRERLKSQYPEGLYSHQSQSITSIINGENVCLATSTASGKSLVFITAAADLILKNPDSKILALYPMKALIQDQLDKWKDTFSAHNLNFGYIDGTVSVKHRKNILNENQVLLMTPDVCHAWLMSNLDKSWIQSFLKALRLVILDESHVYEGVFGTNMAYFLRRLEALSPQFQFVLSTGTLFEAANFFTTLTGRNGRTFTIEEDGSTQAGKIILLTQGPPDGTGYKHLVSLIMNICISVEQQFLVFCDSRVLVERLVTETNYALALEENKDVKDTDVPDKVLPYRAGYEPEDRKQIQKALTKGELRGVVSTSALEMGIDIGGIDLVILVDRPWSLKAFWQRVGRAGRKGVGYCLFIDPNEKVRRLDPYLNAQIEPNIFYLNNRYLQYTNALCTAVEKRLSADLSYKDEILTQLPESFIRYLENEINPTESVPTDLYPLKQRAQGGPHREFPIRTGMEKTFLIKERQGTNMGDITFDQAMRETYPGAVYYYMGKPYRVIRFDFRRGEIILKPEKRLITKPKKTTMVFPRFNGGILYLLRSENCFIAEVEVQVSQKVSGFTIEYGANQSSHDYGPHSEYSQRDISRYFTTTGICFFLVENDLTFISILPKLQEAFCEMFGIRMQDIDCGPFYANTSPLGTAPCKGQCIFDVTEGSLRLTEPLAKNALDVVQYALDEAEAIRDEQMISSINKIKEIFVSLDVAKVDQLIIKDSEKADHIAKLIAPGQQAVFIGGDGIQLEVEVLGYRYTPQGLMYELKPPDAENIIPTNVEEALLNTSIVHRTGSKWMTVEHAIRPLFPETRFIQVNLTTGEEESLN